VTLALLLNKKSPDRIQQRRTTPRRTRKKKKKEEQERRRRKKNKKPRKKHKKEAQNNIQHETKPNHEKNNTYRLKKEKYTAERETPIAGLPSLSTQLASEVTYLCIFAQC
jgi:type IV secretory pathway VirB10-like protein